MAGTNREYIIPDNDSGDDLSEDISSDEPAETDTEERELITSESSEDEETAWFSCSTEKKMIWKGGGVLGAAATTLTSFITYQVTQNRGNAVLSSFIPVGLGLAVARGAGETDNLDLTLGLISFTISAFSSSALNAFGVMSSIQENYPIVAPITSFAIVAGFNLVVPEICQQTSKVGEVVSKLSNSCLSFWNRKTAMPNNANENLLNEVVITERRNSFF